MLSFRKLPSWLPLLAIALSLTACGDRPVVTTLPSPTGSPSPPGLPSPSTSPDAVAPNAGAGVPRTSPPTTAAPAAKSSTSRTIETKLSSLFTSATGISLAALNCPNTIDLKVGNRFDCEALADGQTFAIAVELTDTTGSQFNWSTRGVLQLAKLEQFIQEQVKAKGGTTVTADCGESIRTANPGESFTCQVSAPQGNSRPARVTIKDTAGSVDITL